MKNVKRIGALLLSLLMMISAFASFPASAAEADGPVMAKIKSSGKLVVGTEAQYAPYEFKDLDANFVGCDMFLAQKIADALGVKLEIVDMSFDGIIPAVQAGQVDLGIAAFTNTPERAEVIDFSDLYETSMQYLVVAAGNVDKYATKESLAGLKVGAQKGTIQSQLITKALPDSKLFELDKYPELALEVTVGNIAGLVVDSAVGDSIVAGTAYGRVRAMVNDKGDRVKEAGPSEPVEVIGFNDVPDAGDQIKKAYDDAVALASKMGL